MVEQPNYASASPWYGMGVVVQVCDQILSNFYLIKFFIFINPCLSHLFFHPGAAGDPVALKEAERFSSYCKLNQHIMEKTSASKLATTILPFRDLSIGSPCQ